MPAHPSKRVVVTGLGATTPLGGDVPSTWAALLAGQSGARPLDYPWVAEYDLPVTFGATLAEPAAGKLTKIELRRQDPCAQYAVIAAREAWADAGTPEVEPERLAVSIGSGVGGVHTLIDQWETLRTKGPRRIFPLAVPMLLVNSPTAMVSLELDARAGGHTPVSACASGAEGIAMGLQLIREGRADVVVAGGTEAAIHPLPIGGFAAMQALSTRNDDPQRASRPYDTGRDGFVIAEGAGVIVLEAEEHARARGARVYGELAGYGSSCDAGHLTDPDPTGAGPARAIAQAMADAGIAAGDVDYVNAHATSTPVGDVAEARALVAAGLGACPVSSTKGALGHTLGAAGGVEAVACLLALTRGMVPPTANLRTPDPAVEVDLVREARPAALRVVMSTSFGFGGHNAVLAFRRHGVSA